MTFAPRLAVCLALSFLVTFANNAWAEERSVIVRAPEQIVQIDDEPAQFAARVRICDSGAAEGIAQFRFADNSQLELRAVHGVIPGNAEAPLIIVFVPDGAGDASPGDFVVTTVRPVPADGGCDIWDFTGGTMSGGYVQFEAETSHSPGGHELVISSPQQVVTVGDEGALFVAKIEIAADGAAYGGLRLEFRNGDLLALEAVHATFENRDVGIILDVRPRVDDRGAEIAFVRITPVPGEQDIWELLPPGADGGTQFEAETKIAVERAPDCPPADFGQVPVDFGLTGKRQTVEPVQLKETIDFLPKVKVSFDNSADGVIGLRFQDGDELTYDIFFGAFFIDPRDDSFVVKLVGVERSTGFVLQGTVSASANPDCQIWDLINGESGTVQYTFDAETSLRLRDL